MSETRNAKDLPRLGVFGGTFDPIHNGHLIVAQDVLEKLHLAQVLFLLSARPPHKNSAATASWQDRLGMLRIALKGNPRFQASDIEIKRAGPSYTAETMDQLQARYGSKYHVLFVMGADNIFDVFTWHEPERLLTSRSLVVVPRPGCDLRDLDPGVAEKVTLVQTPLIEISSSEIRQRVREGRSIKYLVPKEVATYIHRQRLYQ